MRANKIEIDDTVYNNVYELMCTTIDEKVCQVITDTSASSNCTVCGAKPSEMNRLQKIRARKEYVGAFQYGIQTLHAWIRFMECKLHISYRIFLLVSADPYLGGIRNVFLKTKSLLLPEAQDLLFYPQNDDS